MTQISNSILTLDSDMSTEKLLFYNDSGELIPAGAMMELDGVDANGIFKAKKPTGDDLGNVLINGDVKIPIKGFGKGWEAGTHPVIFDGDDPDPEDRVGSQTDSWNAKKSGSGTHLVRAISGSIAFVIPFSLGLNRINVISACYVDQDNPDTGGLGYPASPITYKILAAYPGETNWYAVFKFENRCPLVSPLPSGVNTRLALPQNLSQGLESYHPNAGDNVEVRATIIGITEDFDPSSLTWNQLAALGTAGGAGFSLISYSSASAGTANALWIPANPVSTRTGIYVISPVAAGFQGFFSSQVYGFYVSLDFWQTSLREGAWMRYTFNLEDYGPAWNGFLEWF